MVLEQKADIVWVGRASEDAPSVSTFGGESFHIDVSHF